MEKNEKKISYRETLRRNRRAWGSLWRLSPRVFISAPLNSAFWALSPYVTIWFSAQIINELADGRNPQTLLNWVAAQLLSAAVLALIGGLLNRWGNYEWDCIRKRESRIWMNKMLDMDYADLDRQYVFDLYNRIQENKNWVGWGSLSTLNSFQNLCTAGVRILGGVGLSINLFVSRVPAGSGLVVLNNPLFAVGIAALMLAAALISPLCANRGGAYWTRFASETKQGNRFLGFYGFMCMDRNRAVDLRIYSQQENVCNVYIGQDKTFSTKSAIAVNARCAMGLWKALSQIVSVILTGIVYLFVCLKAWAGAFGVGSVTQYVGAITNLFLGISNLLQTLGEMRVNAAFLENDFEFLDIPNSMYQGSLTTEKRADRQYEVEFQDVSFRYPGSDIWALRHVNMKFKVGSRLAIVGENGSGKTTFIKLLCRLYDPQEGQILLNGIDIRKYRYDDYMNIFSVVFQDFQLICQPLGDNVAGSMAYDRERVKKALIDAGFGDRLESMEKGLDTMLYKDLSEDGVDVSGGEAQKIAIARALYKDAPFIILDEPTAALDPIAEAEIYSKFNDIAGDKTAIYISHRLSSCKFCDEIAVFHEGAVIQQGTHEELVADENGKYYALWHAQAQYYTAEA